MDGDIDPPFTADENYAWVKWRSGRYFHFPGAMRRVVAKLCQDFLAGKPSSDGKDLLRLTSAPSVEKVFKVRIDGKLRAHPGWGTMIVAVIEPGARGRYTLRDPGVSDFS